MIQVLKERLDLERKEHQEIKDFAGRMILDLEAKVEKLQMEKEGSLVFKGVPSLKEGYSWTVKERIKDEIKRVFKSKWLYPTYQSAYVDAKFCTIDTPDCAFQDIQIFKEPK